MEYPDHVPSMDHLSKDERNSVDRKSLGRQGNGLPRARQSMNLQDRFKLEKPSPVHADFHRNIMKSSKSFSHQFSVGPQRQRIVVSEVDEDELVKYMSKVPSYLQKGEEAVTERALNVGVLDWGRLEKWKCNQKQIPYRSIGYSPSSSNTSSSFSTDESSTHSSGGHSISPTRQRVRRLSLQSHLSPSLMEGPSQVVDFSGESLGKFREGKSTQNVSFNIEENCVNEALPVSKKHPNAEMKQCKRNPESVKLRDNPSTRAATLTVTKTEMETRAVGFEARDQVKVWVLDSERTCSNGNKKTVLLSPKSDPESSHSSKVHQRSIADGCERACHSKVNSDVTQSVSQPLNVVSNPSRGILEEAKTEIVSPVSSNSTDHSKASEKEPKKATAEKARSLSPFRRFSSGASKTSSVPGSNEGSDMSANTCGPSTGDSSSGGDKPSSTGRSRSSPLRRLLDPLLKPKAEKHRHSVADEQHASFAARSGKVKLGMTGCKKINVNELAMGKKHGPSTVQALLRVAVKNGLPLYTFAVNNENNILAATGKNSGRDQTYTFFTIQDVKKKNVGWRGKSQDYISNVVAQMKVSDFGYSDLTTGNIGVRDFVLFSVDLRQNVHGAPEFHPKDELGAILVKYPKKTSPSSAKDEKRDESEEGLLGDCIGTTVIFPSAIHSLPSKGGPSSLIERWISGGSCDCGGWDLGCKLQILGNRERSRSFKSGHPIDEDRFELFPRVRLICF